MPFIVNKNGSPVRASPRRKSPKRKSPKRKSPKRKSASPKRSPSRSPSRSWSPKGTMAQKCARARFASKQGKGSKKQRAQYWLDHHSC